MTVRPTVTQVSDSLGVIGGTSMATIEVKLVLTPEELEQLRHTWNIILGRIETMATQADVDALKTAVDTLGTDLSTAVTGIQADLDALKAANPTLNLTALTASVSTLGAVVAAAQAVDAENPVPAPPVV